MNKDSADTLMYVKPIAPIVYMGMYAFSHFSLRNFAIISF